jgi:DNA replication protein DnaD
MDLSYLDIDWRKLLVKHYKSYGLTETDLSVILILNDILTPNPSLVSADDLLSYMTCPKEDIDASLVKLLDKKYIACVMLRGKTVTSLEPLYQKILSDLKKDIVIEANEASQKDNQSVVNNLYSFFEETLGRPLTGRETDRISFWIRSGASEALVKEAVEKLKAQNKAISLAAVDKIILALQKSDDISKEGFSSRKEEWREGNEETLSILSKRWVPKD